MIFSSNLFKCFKYLNEFKYGVPLTVKVSFDSDADNVIASGLSYNRIRCRVSCFLAELVLVMDPLVDRCFNPCCCWQGFDVLCIRKQSSYICSYSKYQNKKNKK